MNMAAGQMGAPGQQQQQPIEFQEKQRYCGEQVPLQKPTLQDLRSRIFQMQPDEINRYQSQVNERKFLYFEQPEVKKMQDQVKKLVGELKAQVDENCEEKEQL